MDHMKVVHDKYDCASSILHVWSKDDKYVLIVFLSRLRK